MTTVARDEFLDWDAGTLSRAVFRLGPEQREAMRRHLRSKLPAAVLDYFSADPEREQKILDEIRTAFKTGAITSTRQHPLPSVLTSEHLRDVYDDVVGVGPLEALLRDPQVTSISVIRWDTILVERGKEREEHAETFRDQAHLEQVADNLAVLSGYALSRKVRPRMTHFQVDPPARIHIDVSSVEGPFIGFRRGRATAWPLGELVRRGAMSLEVADLLRRLARAEVSMLVVGPPGAGKTTLLEALIHDLPVRHLVVIEDGVNELRPDHPYVTHIVVPPASEAEGGRTAGDMAEAAKSALRKNTDQVVYGEILDGNAGHVIANASSFRFSATTLHGHTIEAGLSRFCILAQLDNTQPRSPYVGLDNLLVRRDLALCFKVVVLVGRLADDRQVVREIAWLDGLDPHNGTGAGNTGTFKLTRLVTLVEENGPSGAQATWSVNPDFALPGDYAVNLYAQDLAAARRLAAGVTPAAAYQQALTAVHSSNWEAAAGFLLQALEAASASATHHVPGEVIGLLSRVLENGGAWQSLAEHGRRVAQALTALRAERRWEVLEQALSALAADAPLALAVGEAVDLAGLRHAARHGREVNSEVQARLAIAERLAGSGRELEALELLLGDFGEGLEVEHYAALAGAAGAMFDRLGDRLTLLQRAAFRARVDALNCLAEVPGEEGEDPGECRAEEAVCALSSITAKAQQTAQRITHLAEEAWV